MGYVGLEVKSLFFLPYFICQNSPKTTAAIALIGSLLFSKWARKKSLKKCDCTTDLTGKTAIITGGNSGIGKATAIQLAKRNATVIIGCRNSAKGSEAVKEIQKATGNQNVSYKELDLCSFDSVRKFAEEVKQTERGVNILINNAGVISSGGKRALTEDCCGTVMQSNYFGHFLLTLLLTDLMKKSAPSRIINVASLGHRWGSLDLNDLRSVNSGSYYRSKLANVLFTTELSKRLEYTGVTVNVVNPGFTKTRYLEKVPVLSGLVLKILYMLYGKTPFQGSQTTVHLSLSPEMDGVTGRYFSNCKERKLTKAARHSKRAWELFEASQKIVGLKVPSI